MIVWEADFYRRPLHDDAGKPLWELLICDPAGDWRYHAVCAQSQASASWVTAQLQPLIESGPTPDRIRVFRPQTFQLFGPACKTLGIALEPTRRTPTLKQWLRDRGQQYARMPNDARQPYDPLAFDRPPPLPLPENLWGDRWRFATLPAADLATAFVDRMIPIVVMPDDLLPLNLGLASNVAVPGVVIDGGRQSMRLARWLQESQPIALKYVPGAPDGLVLEAGLVDRWIVATFTDADVVTAGAAYEQRKHHSQGLHFLLVQPDDSGITHSGFWLLQDEMS